MGRYLLISWRAIAISRRQAGRERRERRKHCLRRSYQNQMLFKAQARIPPGHFVSLLVCGWLVCGLWPSIVLKNALAEIDTKFHRKLAKKMLIRTKMNPQESKMKRKSLKMEPKGSQGEPKWSHRGAKWAKVRPKCHRKFDSRTRSAPGWAGSLGLLLFGSVFCDF